MSSSKVTTTTSSTRQNNLKNAFAEPKDFMFKEKTLCRTLIVSVIYDMAGCNKTLYSFSMQYFVFSY